MNYCETDRSRGYRIGDDSGVVTIRVDRRAHTDRVPSWTRTTKDDAFSTATRARQAEDRRARETNRHRWADDIDPLA
ncbi:hypothetical protein [Streptosporangium saharense]|uniref:hypothetical protein n=1 Tax=Streptosporangium saharense TaxID=1706840 RepID=UPI003441E1DA